MGDKEGALIEYETGKQLGFIRGFGITRSVNGRGLALQAGPGMWYAKDPHENVVYISRSYYTQDKMRDTLKVA